MATTTGTTQSERQQEERASHRQSMTVIEAAYRARIDNARAAFKAYCKVVKHPPYNDYTAFDYQFAVERDDLLRAMTELDAPMSLNELDRAAGVQRGEG